MDILISTSLEVQENWEAISELSFSQTISTFNEFERNVQNIAAWAVAEPLDMGHIAAPKYIKLKASVPVHVIFSTGTVLNNVTNLEIWGEIVGISVTNSSAAEESRIDFIVAE
jgi:hypothetical protein